MSVIINEFEVVVDDQSEQLPSAQAAAGDQNQPQAPPPVSPSDIRDIMRRQLARMERLWAH